MSTVTAMAQQFVGPAEMIKLLGVSRTRTVQITGQRDFPLPVAVLTMGSIWDLVDVIAWAEHKGRVLNLDALTTDVQAGDDSTP